MGLSAFAGRWPGRLPASPWRVRAIVPALAMAVLALLTMPRPAQAADLTLFDLSLDLGAVRVVIPRVEVAGSSLSEAELRALLDPAQTGELGSRLARLNADSVSIPRIAVEQSVNGQVQQLTYHDTRLGQIRAGVIGEARIASVTGDVADASLGAMAFRIGETVASGIDLPLLGQVLSEASPAPEQVPLRPLYQQISYRDYVVDLPGGAGRFSIARVTSREAMARPGRQPLLTAMRGLIDLSERQKAEGRRPGGTPTRDEMVAMGRFLGFFDHFAYGLIDVEDMRAAFRSDSNTATMSFVRLRFSDQPTLAGLALSDFKAESGPARIALAELEIRDFGFRDSFRTIADILERGALTEFMTNYMRLVPKLGTIRLKGLEMQGPDGARKTPQGAPEVIRASLKNFELGVGAQLAGVPTAIRFSAEELTAPLPAQSRDRSIRDLIAMGFKDVTVSWLADLAWQQERNQLDVKALQFSGKDLASASLTGQIGNVTREAFSPDKTLAQMAWLGASAQRLTFNLTNHGGIEKLFEMEARKGGKTGEALRREWITIAAMALPAIFGDTDGAKALSDAVARFVARPGRLDLDVKARSPSGVGLADVMAVMGQPRAIFDKIDLTARAQ